MKFLSVEALPSSKFWKRENGPISRTVKNIVMKFLLVEALPGSKFWKSEIGPIARTVKNIVMKFCIHIDIDKM